MTDQATRVVPAGWYQDPALEEQVRWWNGLAWTEHVREKPTAAAASASNLTVVTTASSTGATAGTSTATVVETSQQRVAAGRELERQFGIGTSENEIITGATALGFGTGASAGAAGAPSPRTIEAAATVNPAVQRAETDRRAAAARTSGHGAGRSATGSAWMVALTPVLTLVLGTVATYLYFYVAQTLVLFLIAIAVPYLLGLLWALGDGRVLTLRGFDAPSPAWALLGAIVYLIIRRTRVPGTGPLALFLVVGALLIALPIAGISSGQARSLENALTIQSTLNDKLTHSGRAVSVTCPPFVNAITPGTLYTCTAIQATGVPRDVWVSIDGPDGQFSFAMTL